MIIDNSVGYTRFEFHRNTYLINGDEIVGKLVKITINPKEDTITRYVDGVPADIKYYIYMDRIYVQYRDTGQYYELSTDDNYYVLSDGISLPQIKALEAELGFRFTNTIDDLEVLYRGEYYGSADAVNLLFSLYSLDKKIFKLINDYLADSSNVGFNKSVNMLSVIVKDLDNNKYDEVAYIINTFHNSRLLTDTVLVDLILVHLTKINKLVSFLNAQGLKRVLSAIQKEDYIQAGVIGFIQSKELNAAIVKHGMIDLLITSIIRKELVKIL